MSEQFGGILDVVVLLRQCLIVSDVEKMDECDSPLNRVEDSNYSPQFSTSEAVFCYSIQPALSLESTLVTYSKARVQDRVM